jgi:hypothetical protein
MSISVLEKSEEQEWLAYLTSHPKAKIYHHPAWLALMNQQYGFQCHILVSRENKSIVAGIPFAIVPGLFGGKSIIAMPFSDDVEILYENENKKLELGQELLALAKKENISEVCIRSQVSDSTYTPVEEAVVHHLDLTISEDDYLKILKKSQAYRNVQKSLKEDLTVEISNSREAVEQFYALHCLTRRKLGTPVQPKQYFIRLHELLISKNLGFICLVKSGTKPAAAAVFLGYNKILTYKYGASDPGLLHLRPNNLMFWEAIKESRRLGFAVFDFGKTDFENTGLRTFKSNWGGQETTLSYAFSPAPEGSGLLKKIKEVIVAPVIRNSPLFVGRLIGQIAYKYFPAL